MMCTSVRRRLRCLSLRLAEVHSPVITVVSQPSCRCQTRFSGW